MSYNVTITASSLEELADKALALGGRLTLASGRPTVTATEIAEVARSADPVAEVTKVAPAAAPEPAAPAEPAIPDFANEVSPEFLAFVETKGRHAAEALLAEFGAERVSLIDKSKWADLLARLREAKKA